MKRRVAMLALIVFAAACVSHIAPYKPRHRKFDPGTYAAAQAPANGSLYGGGPGFYDDDIAARPGDIVVINIDEHESASHDAQTTLDKDDSANYGLPSAMGILPALQKKFPGIDPTSLFSSTSTVKFAGSGATARNGTFTAILPVRVSQVLPNGDLYVEGNKTVMVGEEEHHLYISGIVRRRDLADDDSVPSSRVAEAEIELTGRGDVSDVQRRGWLSRILQKVWPF